MTWSGIKPTTSRLQCECSFTEPPLLSAGIVTRNWIRIEYKPICFIQNSFFTKWTKSHCNKPLICKINGILFFTILNLQILKQVIKVNSLFILIFKTACCSLGLGWYSQYRYSIDTDINPIHIDTIIMLYRYRWWWQLQKKQQIFRTQTYWFHTWFSYNLTKHLSILSLILIMLNF